MTISFSRRNLPRASIFHLADYTTTERLAQLLCSYHREVPRRGTATLLHQSQLRLYLVSRYRLVKQRVFRQSLVAGAVFLLTTCCGIHVGYSAILIPQLKNENSTLPTDDELGSWIGEILVPAHIRIIYWVGETAVGFLKTGVTLYSTTNRNKSTMQSNDL